MDFRNCSLTFLIIITYPEHLPALSPALAFLRVIDPEHLGHNFSFPFIAEIACPLTQSVLPAGKVQAPVKFVLLSFQDRIQLLLQT